MTGSHSDKVHPNVALVIEAHDRLERGDLAAINEMFAEEIIWHEFGSSPLAGSYAGRDAVMAFWKRYFAATGDTFTQDIVSIMANDNYVSTIVKLGGTKSTGTLSQNAVDVMRITDDKITEFWRYYSDLGGAEEFFNAS